MLNPLELWEMLKCILYSNGHTTLSTYANFIECDEYAGGL